MMAEATYLLGRQVEHDPRSKTFAHARSAQPLVSRVWKRTAPALTQKIGSCTGNALIGVCLTEPFTKAPGARVTLGEADAEALYSAATKLDTIPGHWPPTDTGSSGLAVCKAAKKLGLIKGYRHAFDLAAALDALAHVGPLISGFNWYEGMDRPIGMRSELRISGAIRGGHEVEILTIDVIARTVGGINSWGPKFGSHGRFVLSWDTWGRLLSEDGDATIPLAK